MQQIDTVSGVAGSTRRRSRPRATLGMFAVGALATTALLAGAALPASGATTPAAAVTPLANNTPLKFPIPVTAPDDFSYNLDTVYWSVVAMSPPLANPDLGLYDDPDHANLLQESRRGIGVVDFIAVDSNHRPPGDYYPSVNPGRGTGEYTIELAQGEGMLFDTLVKLKMTANDLVAVRDTFLLAGKTYTITVTPANATQNPSLFLMASNGSYFGTWVKSRLLAEVAADIGAPGKAETITYKPTVSDWYGVVVINEAGSGAGTYKLKRAIS